MIDLKAIVVSAKHQMQTYKYSRTEKGADALAKKTRLTIHR